jgi:DNA replication protein DnaC
MEEKNVRYIRSLASPSGEHAGGVMPQNMAVMQSDSKSTCAECGGTGWKQVVGSATQQVARCGCFFRTRSEALRSSAAIPERFRDCTFSQYQTKENSLLARAKLVMEKWALEYPLDRTGLLLLGPSGLGKTHLSVAVLKELIKKGVPCLFCDYLELLKQIQNSYNPSSETSELGLLRPIFDTEVVVLDDLGAQKPSQWVWDTVSLILNSRYNSKKPTIITTNTIDGRSATAEGVEGPKRATRIETLGDRVGERMRSRLFEMCRFIQIQGEDYRSNFRKSKVGPPLVPLSESENAPMGRVVLENTSTHDIILNMVVNGQVIRAPIPAARPDPMDHSKRIFGRAEVDPRIVAYARTHKVTQHYFSSGELREVDACR